MHSGGRAVAQPAVETVFCLHTSQGEGAKLKAVKWMEIPLLIAPSSTELSHRTWEGFFVWFCGSGFFWVSS